MTTSFDQRGTRAGMVRFDGNATVFFVAICEQCQMALPFPSEKDRGDYIVEHVKTGHTLKIAVDVRPDPIQSEKRKDSLVAALREKYARPAKAPAGCENADNCRRLIKYGEPMVSFAGKFYHAECLDDAYYLRIASITDIMPGIFDELPKIQATTIWRPGDDDAWATANPSYGRPPHQRPIVGGAMSTTGFHMDTQRAESAPKKMNARERRRQRRKDKQWQKK